GGTIVPIKLPWVVMKCTRAIGPTTAGMSHMHRATDSFGLATLCPYARHSGSFVPDGRGRTLTHDAKKARSGYVVGCSRVHDLFYFSIGRRLHPCSYCVSTTSPWRKRSPEPSMACWTRASGPSPSVSEGRSCSS